jgi:hypothetical protein
VRLAGYSSFSTLLVAFTVLAMVLTKEVGGTHHAVVVTQLWQLQLVALAAAAIALARSTGKGAWVPTVAASASAIAAALLAANVSSGRAWLAALNPATPINPVFTPVVYELADLTVRKPDVPLVMVDWGIGNNLQSLLPSGQRERVRDFWPMFRSIAAGSTSPAELRLALGDAKDVLFVMRSMQTAVFKDTLKGFEKVLVASSDCRSERQELKDGTAIVQFIVVLVETSCLRGAT